MLARIHRLHARHAATRDRARLLGRVRALSASLAARRAGTRLHGIDGTLQVIRQLEGYEIPAAAWETHVLPARVAGYRREYLDQLCYSGEVMWGRLSRASGARARTEEPKRRIRPTQARADLAVLARERRSADRSQRRSERRALSHAAREVLEEIDDAARRSSPISFAARNALPAKSRKRSGNSSPPGSSPPMVSTRCAR